MSNTLKHESSDKPPVGKHFHTHEHSSDPHAPEQTHPAYTHQHLPDHNAGRESEHTHDHLGHEHKKNK